MVRQAQFALPGALCHVAARGNGGDAMFVTDDDCKVFLHRLWGLPHCFNAGADPIRIGKVFNTYRNGDLVKSAKKT